MNEQINGLWWKARIGYNNQNCDPEVLEKFALLLEKDIEARHFSAGYIAGQSDGIKETVKQCLLLCDQVDLAGADDCIDKIRDHFGVNE